MRFSWHSRASSAKCSGGQHLDEPKLGAGIEADHEIVLPDPVPLQNGLCPQTHGISEEQPGFRVSGDLQGEPAADVEVIVDHGHRDDPASIPHDGWTAGQQAGPPFPPVAIERADAAEPQRQGGSQRIGQQDRRLRTPATGFASSETVQDLSLPSMNPSNHGLSRRIFLGRTLEYAEDSGLRQVPTQTSEYRVAITMSPTQFGQRTANVLT